MSSARTGLVALRSICEMARTSDALTPNENVTAATPTSNAPRVIVARTGWARPAATPSRVAIPAGSRSPSRRNRPPSGRPDGLVPLLIARTALDPSSANRRQDRRHE